MKINNLTVYVKNYTKIFKDWVESRTPVPNYKKKKNKIVDILLRISIRGVSSLIAIQIFNKVKDIPYFQNYISYILIALFVYFFIQENN